MTKHEPKHLSCECCILGAGPAGFGAALELIKAGVRDVIVVDQNKIVGGLARTESFDGNRFDIGPHRFYTKNEEIRKLWTDTLGDDFRPVARTTRILYKNKLFSYPLRSFESLYKLGILESLDAVYSFGLSRLSAQGEATNVEDWIVRQFGRKLYETFFKTYTEKVWGISCKEISAEWAAQRIKGLDLAQALKRALRLKRSEEPKTLVERFDYPVLGAGQMYEVMAGRVADGGGRILLNHRVKGFNRKDAAITSVDVAPHSGDNLRISARQFFNSIPLTSFVQLLVPAAPSEALEAAKSLYYRDHITVNLLIDKPKVFPDQWIYVHSPEVQMARVANYNNFSDRMVKVPGHTGLSVEYFVFQHEALWRQPDEAIKELAISELQLVRLVDPRTVRQAWVVRETQSYPTYYLGFQKPYGVILSYIDHFENIYPIGRGGLYKYNNQDHSALSGILAARNYLKVTPEPYNLWNINIDAEYVESGAYREASH